MKYQFNKTFPLLIKLDENAEKPHFNPKFGLLGPNFGHIFFFEVSALLDARYCSKLQSCTI